MTGQIHEALAAVMADCTHVAKRDRNDHQRFMFRGIDAVVNAVGPILREHHVTVRPVVQHVSYDVVQTTTGKPATACRVIVDYVFGAPDGSEITATVAAEAWDSGDKAAPKAMSVAFRTALLQTLALPTDEPDPDSHTFERQQVTQQPQAGGNKASKAQIAKIHASLSELSWPPAWEEFDERTKKLKLATIATGREITSTADLTAAEAGDFITYIATRIADQKKEQAS